MGIFAALDPVRDEAGRITMRVPKPRLGAMLSQAYKKVEEARGFPVTPEETVWLYELAKECIYPKADQPPSFLVPPVVLGAGTPRELVLHELTVLSIAWLENYAVGWWRGDSLDPVVFAHAHSGGENTCIFREPKMLAQSSAVAEVSRFMKTLPYSESVLAWACNVLSGVGNEHVEVELPREAMSRDENATAVEWGRVISTLSVFYGIKPSELYTMGEKAILDLWHSRKRNPMSMAMDGGEDEDKDGGTKSFLAFNGVVRMLCEVKHGE